MAEREARKSRALIHLQLVEPDKARVVKIVESFPLPLSSDQKELLREKVHDALTYHHFLSQPYGRPTTKQLGEQAATITKVSKELVEAVTGSYAITHSPMLDALATEGEAKCRALGRGYDDQPKMVGMGGATNHLSDAHLMGTLRRVIYLRGLAKRLQAKARRSDSGKKSQPPATLEGMCVSIFAEVTGKAPKVDQDFVSKELHGDVVKFIKSVDRTIPESRIKRAVSAFNRKNRN